MIFPPDCPPTLVWIRGTCGGHCAGVITCAEWLMMEFLHGIQASSERTDRRSTGVRPRPRDQRRTRNKRHEGSALFVVCRDVTPRLELGSTWVSSATDDDYDICYNRYRCCILAANSSQVVGVTSICLFHTKLRLSSDLQKNDFFSPCSKGPLHSACQISPSAALLSRVPDGPFSI